MIQRQDRTNFIRQNFLRNWHFAYSSSLQLKFQPTVYCLISVINLDLHTMPGISALDSQHDILNLKEIKRLILCYENGAGPENVTYDCLEFDCEKKEQRRGGRERKRGGGWV